MTTITFNYVTYISSTLEKVWDALTKTEHTEVYFFGTAVKSEWKVGSRVEYSRGDVTDYGEILSYEPNREMTYTWESVNDETIRQKPTVVTFKLHQMDGDVVRLSLTHENLLEADYVEDNNSFQGFNNGWPFILSNMKTYLETGKTLKFTL
ncbi:SRPBCC family protein [Paenisporosarcina sp. TG20]|uniref:SRPBCC family protein n=1 Tax=Paenisporosarcina sp. TG20 TaxID=1211706 RepID=UPI0002E06E06|nr:SRPBCC family protein [Paenisporosarcina sp. TG20]